MILLAIARQFMCWYGLLGMCLVVIGDVFGGWQRPPWLGCSNGAVV